MASADDHTLNYPYRIKYRLMHLVQQKLLKLVETYNLGSMSFREIAGIIGEKHPQLVKHHLEQLEKKELIRWNRGKQIITKNILGVTNDIDFTFIPVLGSANCGAATVYAQERIESHIKVSNKLLGDKKQVFAIRAIGHSMNNANIRGRNIEEGDYVIIDPNDKNISSNEYVLSVIDDVANIKKIIIDRQNGQIALISESTFQYPEIYIEESEASKYLINGKVIQIIKQVRY